jgi:DNA invertase Pin-like site-specific DNA recombinase
MRIGYARVSTRDQHLDLQLDALRQAGCERVYEECQSGSFVSRPQLDEVLRHLRAGDVLVVWKLDRLGRSLSHLIELTRELESRGVGLVSLHDPVDTTTPQGRLMFTLFAALAEFEREVIRERTQAGLRAARERGHHGGRKPGLSPEAANTAAAAEALYKEGKLTTADIARRLHISRKTLYKYLRIRGVRDNR